VGYERVQEIEDPELASQRTTLLQLVGTIGSAQALITANPIFET